MSKTDGTDGIEFSTGRWVMQGEIQDTGVCVCVCVCVLCESTTVCVCVCVVYACGACV